MQKKRVLIIGSGSRVQKTILPALACLSDTFSILGICSRQQKQVVVPGQLAPISTISDLGGIDFKSIDIIIVAITSLQVLPTIKLLIAHDVRQSTLFLDTPVLPPKDIGGLRLLSRFRRVYVSEDYIGLTSYDIISNLIRRGVIGKLRYIYLFHSGYKYHALALLKKLTSSSYIRSARLIKRNGEIHEMLISLPNGVYASIIGPRDYSIGRFLIVGEKGAIADYPISSVPVTTLHYLYRKNIYIGVRLTGDVEESMIIQNKRYQALSSQFIDTTTINCQKIEGFMRLLVSSLETTPRYAYSCDEGMYDAIVSIILDKFSFFLDYSVPLHRYSIVQLAIRLAKRLMPV